MEMERLTKAEMFVGDAGKEKELEQPKRFALGSVAGAGCGARTNGSPGDDLPGFSRLHLRLMNRRIKYCRGKTSSCLPNERRIIPSKSCKLSARLPRY